MKKILTSFAAFGKGQPFETVSCDHIQQAYTEVIDALVKGLITYNTGDVIILYGCVLSGTDPGSRSVTAGAIYYNGEIYLVDAQTITTSGGQIPLWTIVTSGATFDPTAFTDGTTATVHISNKFVLAPGNTGGSGIAGYICDYNFVKYYKVAATSPTLQTGWIDFGGGAFSSVKYKKSGNTVFISGAVQRTTGGSNLIFTLPSGLTPFSIINMPVAAVNASSVFVTKYIFINTDGSVHIDSTTNIANTEALCLDISYQINPS